MSQPDQRSPLWMSCSREKLSPSIQARPRGKGKENIMDSSDQMTRRTVFHAGIGICTVAPPVTTLL
jgi:hypothetical protein